MICVVDSLVQYRVFWLLHAGARPRRAPARSEHHISRTTRHHTHHARAAPRQPGDASAPGASASYSGGDLPRQSCPCPPPLDPPPALELRGGGHGAAGYRRGVWAEVGCHRLCLELGRLVEEVEVEAEGEEGQVERGVLVRVRVRVTVRVRVRVTAAHLRDEPEELGEAAAVVGGVPGLGLGRGFGLGFGLGL